MSQILCQSHLFLKDAFRLETIDQDFKDMVEIHHNFKGKERQQPTLSTTRQASTAIRV